MFIPEVILRDFSLFLIFLISMLFFNKQTPHHLWLREAFLCDFFLLSFRGESDVGSRCRHKATGATN